MSSKKPAKDKSNETQSTQPVTRPTQSSVHRLYETGHGAGGCSDDHFEAEKPRKSRSDPVSMKTIGNLLDTVKNTPEEKFFTPNYGRSLSINSWVGIGGSINANNFTLLVRDSHNAHQSLVRSYSVHVRQEEPRSCMNEIDSNICQELEVEDPSMNPMFHIEIESSGEISPSSNGVSLQLTFTSGVDHNMNHVILQQEHGSKQWQNITDKCTTIQGSSNIQIPVNKSSKIWVIRLRKSLGSIKHALLALFHGQILFHILVYYLKKSGKVKVRVIGIGDKLYQNRKGLRTAVEVAKELQFVEGDELPAKQLVKKGRLMLEVHQGSECVCRKEFNIGRSTLNKNAEWHDYTFNENDMEEDLKMKVIVDQEGVEEWPIIDLNEMLCDKIKDEDEKVFTESSDPRPPIISCGFKGEVREDDMAWLARHLNNDVDKVARWLNVNATEISNIRRGSDSKETQDIRILLCWITETRKSGSIPTWKTIKDILENEDVRRLDVIRARLNEEEISDRVFLWLEPRVAASCIMLGRVLELPDHEIEKFFYDSQDNEKRCKAILKRWRERTRTPKIETLVQALEHDILKKYELAKEMREKFLKDNSELLSS